MLTLKEAKRNFFDRDAVLKRVDAVKVKVLSKGGAFVRQRARSSMRRRKGSSKPGSPPSAHKNALLKEKLFFSYDPSTDSVVVGPVALSRKPEAPALNEFGGTVTRRRHGRTRVATYPERPYMAPALKAEEPKLPSYWHNTVSGGI